MASPGHQIYQAPIFALHVHLNREEEAILQGERGEALATALSLLVDVGDFYEASHLLPIGSAHISGVSYLTGGDGLIDQLDYFVELGATVSVYSTLNPSGMDRNQWKDHYIDLEFATKQFRILDNFKRLGVITTLSCTPYDFGHILTKGQHVAWAESSAITFANSFFGARTNKEDALSVLAAAIVGKTPNYGFHLTENRLPNVLIKVEADIRDYSDYSVLGEVVGRAFNRLPFPYGAIPLFEGISNPRPHHLKGLGAALASFGTQLFHVRGVTPEVELYENAKDFEDELVVEQSQLDEIYEHLKPDFDPKIAVIGCPNANLEEIREVAEAIGNRKLIDGREFWVFTNRAQKGMAEAVGLVEILEKAGVKILVDTCPEVTPYDRNRFDRILTNSIKAQHYISAPSLNGIPTYLLPLRKCVDLLFQEVDDH